MCCPPFTVFRHHEKSASSIHYVPSGLLQLVLVRLPACNVSHLQSIQNAAGHLFGGVFIYDSVEHILHDNLHWLPVMRELNSRLGCLDTRLVISK